jgi:hypothetical protein
MGSRCAARHYPYEIPRIPKLSLHKNMVSATLLSSPARIECASLGAGWLWPPALEPRRASETADGNAECQALIRDLMESPSGCFQHRRGMISRRES